MRGKGALGIVLIADDDPEMRTLLTVTLEAAGLECVTARNGEEALHLSGELNPELVILDVHMPGLNGFETYRRIRQNEVLANTPVIFLTASGDEAHILAGLDLGADDYLIKPFNPVTLPAKIRNILSRHRKYKSLSDEDFVPGSVIRDRYKVIREIGRGGMGVVYKVRDLKVGELRALKVLSSTVGRFEARARFEREVKTLTKLEHPNLVRFYDAELVGLLQFYTMDFVPGTSLTHKLAEETVPVPEALRLVYLLADALAVVHSHDILHRDVKPGNILFKLDGQPVLVDFGLMLAPTSADRRLTRTGMVAGTVGYMSPEQVHLGEDLDGRTDVYALGVVLYEMLSGRVPFTGTNAMDIMTATVSKDPKPLIEVAPQVPQSVSDICARALSRERDDRYPSAAAMAKAVLKALDELTSE